MTPACAKLLSLAALLLAMLPFFFVGGPGYHSARSFAQLWNLGHVFFFALFSTLLFHILILHRPQWPRRKALWLIFAATLVTGIGIELLQFFIVGRDGDVVDVFRNQMGVLLFFAFQLNPPFFRLSWAQNVLHISTVLLLGLTSWPFVTAVVDEGLALHQFPLLSGFETPFEASRWMHPKQFKREQALVRQGKQAARIRLSTAKFSGVSLFHFPGDWRGYRWLRFSVYNPLSRPLELHCRLHDAKHQQHGAGYADRFNEQFNLKPGWNDLSLSLDRATIAPKGRLMDMGRIEGFGLFVVQQTQPLDIVLDQVYLER